MDTGKNKSIAQAHMDAWNNRDLDAFDRLFDPAYKHHDSSQPAITDLAGLKMFAQGIWNSFSDFGGEIDHLVAEGDMVAKRYHLWGTHTGDFMGVAPTGNRIEVTGITVYRIEGDRIVESWWNYDALSMMQQLGAIPQPA